MTYPPGGPGYPSQQPSQYSAPTQQFERPTDSGAAPPQGASKLPVYLGAAVAVLGLATYLASFGPLYEIDVAVPRGGSPAGGAVVASSSGSGSLLVLGPVLAGLLAGVSLLPKQVVRSGVVAVLAVLGFLLVVANVGGPVGWAFYLILVFSILQVGAAVWLLLLDAGIVTAPTPRPRPEASPYGAYGQPPQYYGQPSYGAPGGPGQQPGYQPQYGGYPGGGPGTGGFQALNRPGGPPNGPQSGPPTPPTGFPAFGQPPSAQSSGDQQANPTAQPSQQSTPPQS